MFNHLFPLIEKNLIEIKQFKQNYKEKGVFCTIAYQISHANPPYYLITIINICEIAC